MDSAGTESDLPHIHGKFIFQMKTVFQRKSRASQRNTVLAGIMIQSGNKDIAPCTIIFVTENKQAVMSIHIQSAFTVFSPKKPAPLIGRHDKNGRLPVGIVWLRVIMPCAVIQISFPRIHAFGRTSQQAFTEGIIRLGCIYKRA